jgi:putative transposase
MGISRQAHYKGVAADKRRCHSAAQVVQSVKDQRMHHPRLGTRKLKYLLDASFKAKGIKLGRDALFDLLRGAGLLVKPYRAYHKTTNSHHRFWRHPNLLKDQSQQSCASGAEQVWVADITYLPTQEQCVYISLITDVYSRKIVGYNVSGSLHTVHVTRALKMALRARSTSQQLIHHSDRGIQYCSQEYQRVIELQKQMACSMTDGYDCYQNALAERINGILKSEYLLHKPANLQEANVMVEQSIHLYNHERPHTALKYKTPDEVHQASIQSQLALCSNRQTVNF